MFNISVIIVSYLNEKTISLCLNSVIKCLRNFNAEVILIDNNSQDNTVNLAKKFKNNKNISFYILENKNNLGFTRALNQGLVKSTGKYILILNPDTELFGGFFRPLINIIESDASVGAVAPQHISTDNKLLRSCREFPSHMDVFYYITGLSFIFKRSMLFNKWKMGSFDHNSRSDVKQPEGACLFTDRGTLNSVGYWDENYPMFFSDVDWCKRVYENGNKIIFTPESKIIHHKGVSIRKRKSLMVISSTRSFCRYFYQNYKGIKWVLPNVIVSIALIMIAVLRVLLLLPLKIIK